MTGMASTTFLLTRHLLPLRRLSFSHFKQRELQENKKNGVLKLSEACVKRLNEISEGNYLRITVEGGGCSGFQYKFSLDETVNEDDEIFEDQGAKVIIDSTSLQYLDGSVVDYHSELIRSSFLISNIPKAEGGCSCGASFSLKVD